MVIVISSYRLDQSDDVHSDKEDDGPNFKTSGKLAAETNTYKVNYASGACAYHVLCNVGSCYYLQ